MTDSFELVFAVPMECEACVDSVKTALQKMSGIKSFDINLKSNMVVTNGNISPSNIVKTIQATGRDAILRGTGKPNSAAVCILESFAEEDKLQSVKGLARVVSVGPNDLYVDLTVNGLPKGTYYPSIRTSGNLSQGALSTGKSYYTLDPVEVLQPTSSNTTINSIGAKTHAETDNLYAGQSFLHANLNIDELIGRSVVLSTLKNEVTPNSLCGVIARSAGAWENDKQVCSCTGKSLWQERTDAVSHGIVV